MVTLLVMVLQVTPAEASFLVIWISLAQIVGRGFGSWITDLMGRRTAGALCCALAATTTSLARYLHPVYLGAVPMFFALLLVQGFLATAIRQSAILIWPRCGPPALRASGFGFVYGISNLGNSSARPGWR